MSTNTSNSATHSKFEKDSRMDFFEKLATNVVAFIALPLPFITLLSLAFGM